MRVLILIEFVLVLTLLFVSGCSSVKEVVNVPAEPVSVSPDPVMQARAGVESALNKNQLLTAQEELVEARQNGIAEASLQDLFVVVEKRLLSEARVAEEAGLFDKAGELYRRALDVYPESEQLAALIPAPRDDVKVKLDRCADELMKRGLMDYRAGNLFAAVQTWKKIAVFKPDHSSSVVAIETAEQQIANLEKLSPAQNN